MDTGGAAPCQLGAGQGAAASAVVLAGAKPSSSLSWPQRTSNVRGAHARPWGLKIAGKVWEHRLGYTVLCVKRAKTPCQLPWLWAAPAGWDWAEGSSPFHQQWAMSGMSGLWETQVTCPQLVAVPDLPVTDGGGPACPAGTSWDLCCPPLWSLGCQSCRGQRGHLPVTGASRTAGWVFPIFHSGGTETQSVGFLFRHWNVVSIGDGYKQATISMGKEMNSLPVIISKEQ